MKLRIGEKELNIKFGYKPTLKARIMSRLVRFDNLEIDNSVKGAETLEDLLLFMPEFLLAGLQCNHKEYTYNYDTGEGKDEQIDAAFLLIEEYLESEDANIMKLFKDLEEEMFENGFLKKVFQEEQKKLEQIEETAQPKLEVVESEN